MDEHTDRLTDDLRAAKPALRPSADEWVEGDRGQRVLERVLASGETTEPASSARTMGVRGRRGRAWRPYHTVAVAAALVLIVLGASVWLVFSGRESVAPQPAAGVTKLSAVEHVMQLVFTSISWSAESVGTATTDEALLLSAAVERGLITSSEVDAGPAVGRMLEGPYAVLLWKAFGHYFPDVNLDAQLATAVEGLRGLGVIRESDGAFVPDHPLSSEREQLLLARMQAALRGDVPR
jgi:hypothetical protein